MGYAIRYRTTRPVSPAAAEAIRRAGSALREGRTWLGCEPPHFSREYDGHISGFSKPNIMPHPDDAASAAEEGLPDGTTRDLLDILCQLSREHGVDWEIGDDYGDATLGYIREGVAEPKVEGGLEALADVYLQVAGEGDPEPRMEDDEDGPSILPFRPKGV